MKQVKCDSCGKVQDTPDSRDLSTGAVPPKGWRSISTTIVEHDGEGTMDTSEGDELLSCDDCNAQMSVDEHHEAELLWRKNVMAAQKLSGEPVDTEQFRIFCEKTSDSRYSNFQRVKLTSHTHYVDFAESDFKPVGQPDQTKGEQS